MVDRFEGGRWTTDDRWWTNDEGRPTTAIPYQSNPRSAVCGLRSVTFPSIIQLDFGGALESSGVRFNDLDGAGNAVFLADQAAHFCGAGTQGRIFCLIDGGS